MHKFIDNALDHITSSRREEKQERREVKMENREEEGYKRVKKEGIEVR